MAYRDEFERLHWWQAPLDWFRVLAGCAGCLAILITPWLIILAIILLIRLLSGG